VIAEGELISNVALKDDWPVLGLAHIKSQAALPVLYSVLERAKGYMKVAIAYSIYSICRDEKMIDVVLAELPKVNNSFGLIDIVHLLPVFQDIRVKEQLEEYRHHKDFLVAYNATVAMGLSTDGLVTEYRNKSNTRGFWSRIFCFKK
jgi:hypothetical protein